MDRAKANMADGESFEDWAYAMFGRDCCPVIETHNGEPCLGITDRSSHRRYAIPLRLLRQNLIGEVTYTWLM